MILWLKDKHLKISLDGEVVYCWYDMLMTTVVKDEEVEKRISMTVKTSTESWSVRGMIWTVYKHWSAPSFEKMFRTVIDSEKFRTMSPSPGDR